MKIDLHVHSMASRRPAQWILQKIGCPESFTEPLEIYRIARQSGMTAVTITDHNAIDSALEIAHLPDTFVSEEITTYFPDSGCKIHVLAYDISERQHQDIQHIRDNIFDLVEYLNRQNIFHAAAHPLYSINGKLSSDLFEKLLLLFKVLEINGARNDRENICLEQISTSLGPDDIARMADRHDLQPYGDKPWIKCLIGGSDDHSSLNIARAYTHIEGADSTADAFHRIEANAMQVVRRPSTPKTMAHNLYGIAYQFYRSKFNLDRYADKDIMILFLERCLRPFQSEARQFKNPLYFIRRLRHRKSSKANVPDSLMDLLKNEARKLLESDPHLMKIARTSRPAHAIESNWFHFVNHVSNQVILHFANHLMDHLSGANVFNLFHTVGSAGGLFTLLSPYFISYSMFSKDREFSRKTLETISGIGASNRKSNDSIHIAHFTDTFYNINGVALTLQQQVKAAVKNHKRYTVLTCDGQCRRTEAGIRLFKAVGEYELPEYPEQKICYPPLLEMLDFCYEQGINRIISATPGPVGLAALAIARILKLPVYGTYHTSLPQYAGFLTGDSLMEDLTWRYMIWYYDQMDCIYVPSQSTASELMKKGIDRQKIRIFPRGIDIERFHPGKRNGHLRDRYGIDEKIKLLYVGRVSREKNLDLLCEAFKQLTQTKRNVHLIVVGDGPYLEEMRRQLREKPCTFTGYMEGDDLSAIYASSDVFVFPSATDTFGNVVLEAQASGLPVIVSNQGGPKENMIPGKTGLEIPADNADSLAEAMNKLIDHPDLRKKMGQNGRQYMEKRSFEHAYLQTWDLYTDTEPVAKAG